jgi:hypothetical protein
LALCGLDASTQSKFLVWTYAGIQQPTTLTEVDVNGQGARSIATFPPGFIPQRVIMAENNRDALVLGRGTQSEPVILRVTPAGVITTAFTQMFLGDIFAAMRDADGDWILLRSATWPARRLDILRVGAAGMSTLFTSSSMIGYAANLDPDTGDVLVRGQIAGLPVWVTGYYRVDIANNVVSSVYLPTANAQNIGLTGAHQLPYDVARDALFDLEQDLGITRKVRIVSVSKEQGATPLTPWLANRAMIDLALANGRRLPITHHVLTRSTVAPTQVFIDDFRFDGTHAGGRRVALPDLYAMSSLTRIGGRHLSWFMTTPPNGRRLQVDVPGEAGRAYAVALSFTGAHPGLVLPDGRMVPLVPDRLTTVSVHGTLPGILAGTVGTLDANGRATVKIDTNAVGNQLRGARIWAAAVVLDRASPSGIAHILGPELLTITR